MKRVKTNDLVAGMVVAKDVYNYRDQLIISAGTVLTDQTIVKLAAYSIYFVTIEEEEQKEQEKVESYASKVRKSEEFKAFKSAFEENVSIMKILMTELVEEGATESAVEAVVNNTMQMLEDKFEDVNIFDMVHNMREYDDQTYAHSLNVALIASVLAKWLGMSRMEQRLAFACGILHDIGKLKIPEEIIGKKGKLTEEEYEIVKTHPIEGYNLIKHLNLDEHIKKSVLMHHERYDGSGYPLGMKGDDIDKFARIVIIADVYEATTAARCYRGALCPFQVVAIFESEGLQKYDTRMIRTFLEKIVDIYMLNRVRLSNGMEGEIIFINKQALSRPTVMCGDTFVDLAKQKDLEIVAII